MPVVNLRRLDGKIQFSTSALTFQCIAKGTADVTTRKSGNTNPGSVLVPIPGPSTTRIVATQSTFGAARAGTYQDSSGQLYYHWISSVKTGQMRYWMFDISSNLPPSPHGLTLRNPDNNQIIYSSDYDLFRPRFILENEGSSVILDSSREWAAVQCDWAGHRHPLAPGSY